MYRMDNLNESLKEAVCIEEEVFFGPVADKERKIREQFENGFLSENKLMESHPAVENDISKNDSLYKSFSIEESKYDSFDDSLNEDNRPQETKPVILRKSFDKLKPKRHSFYDSLEDVCSLASNIDKCSISCEVENNSNFNNKHVIDDSLKNPPIAIANKSNGASEQIHFDDDSLAILELENAFDDSLEEINDVCVLSNIEIEEIDDIENMAAENQNIAIKVEQNPACFPRNLFDTSVQIVYEKKWASDTTEQEESSDDKNILYDSLSNSDFKDILKDSLEESEKRNESLNLFKHFPGETGLNIQKSEGMFTDKKMLDTSVQIVYENLQNVYHMGNNSEKSNSEYNEFSKDSLEKCKNVNGDLTGPKVTEAFNSDSSNMNTVLSKISSENTKAFEEKSKMPFTDVSDNVLHSVSNANQNDKVTKDNFVIPELVISVPAIKNSSDNELHSTSNTNQNTKIMKDISDITKPVIPASGIEDSNDNLLHSDSNQNFKIMNDTSVITEPVIPASSIENGNDNALHSESNANQNYKIMKDTSVITEPVIPVSTVDNCSNKEAFSVDSCHLKLLNNDLNTDKDLKFQLHLEVTVGDKKCQLASQEIKVLPSTDVHFKKYENEFSTGISSDHVSQERDAVDKSNSKLKSDEYNTAQKNCAHDEAIPNEIFCEMSHVINASNITHRAKSVGFHLANGSEEKVIFPESLSNISLLQALDLHDISASFLNESIVQSNDSLMPLNLCCKDQNIYKPIFRDESKENVPQPSLDKKKGFCTSSRKASPNKICISKTSKHFQKSPSLKDSVKKTGTKIPVRKIENFAIPTVTPNKVGKQMPPATEKANKCKPSPHSASKKTPVSTPNKTPHFCKVRNTIFSKVPQIVPSKKYMNIQSPVAEYIKTPYSSGKTAHFDPVLRDCMNQPLESPFHSHHTPKSGSLKSTKKKN